MEASEVFYGKRKQEDELEIILVETDVYSCSEGSCIGWMRKDFATDDLLCPMCGHETVMETRELPKM
jgi:hypothetical protein